METYNYGNMIPATTGYNNVNNSGHNQQHHNHVVYTSNGMINGNSNINNSSNNNRDALKRNLTLDLDSNKSSSSVIKKTKLNSQSSLITPINPNNRLELLSSPDLHMLKLGSPEIERLILQQNITILQTPNSLNNSNNQLFFPKNSYEEQEVYVKGFHDALTRIQQNNNNNNMTNDEYNHHGSFMNGGNNGELETDWGRRSDDQENVNSSSADDEELDTDDNSMTSSSMMSSYSSNNGGKVHGQHGGHGQQMAYGNGGSMYPGVVIKQEPGCQIVPTMSSHNNNGNNNSTMSEMNPIDMASQEKIKLERKRQRNRLAASKCRKRKLERIAKLEDKVKQIKLENSELNNIADKLRDSVKRLRAEISSHQALGCTFTNSYSV